MIGVDQMELQTKIGTFKIEEDDIIHFPTGILGFSELRRYVIIDRSDSVFSFLQSVDEPDLTFVVIQPELVVGEYSVRLRAEEIDLLRIASPEDGRVYAIVTIPEDVAAMTVNLQAPLVINTKDRFAAQIIVADDAYHTKHNLLAEMHKNEFLMQKKKQVGQGQEEQEEQEEIRGSV